MTVPNRPLGQTKYSEQNMGNTSFDEDFGVNAVEPVVYNPVTGQLDRMVQPGQTIPTSGTNPSTVLSYDGSGNLQYLDKVINGDTYRKTFTWVAGVLTNISAAVKL